MGIFDSMLSFGNQNTGTGLRSNTMFEGIRAPMPNDSTGFADYTLGGNSGGFDTMKFSLGDNWGKMPTLGGVGSLGNADRGMGSSFFRQKYGDGSTGGGWGEAGLGIASGLFNGALAYGAYKDSKEQTRFAKDNANRNMRNSETAFNMKVDSNAKDLADRAVPGNTIAEDYSKKYRIA